MKISDYAIKKAEIEVPFLELDNVYITIAKLANEDIIELRKQCSLGKRLNTITKTWEEHIDNERFLRLYADAVIIDWKGLKGKHLLDLLMIKLPAESLEEDVECTSDNKYTLLDSSTDFDSFLTSILGDVTVFNGQIAEQEIKK